MLFSRKITTLNWILVNFYIIFLFIVMKLTILWFSSRSHLAAVRGLFVEWSDLSLCLTLCRLLYVSISLHYVYLVICLSWQCYILFIHSRIPVSLYACVCVCVFVYVFMCMHSTYTLLSLKAARKSIKKMFPNPLIPLMDSECM